MAEQRKKEFDWRTFVASTVVTLIASAPSWVPVFGGEYADFGAALWAGIVGFSPVLCMALGFIIGWNVRNRQAKEEREAFQAKIKELEQRPEKMLGMTLEEAAERLDEDKRQANEDEHILLSLPLGAQLICLTAWNAHEKQRANIQKLTDAHVFYGEEGCQEAESKGFVRFEPCGRTGEVRIEPTPKLVRLCTERLDVRKKLIDTAVRTGDPDWTGRDWHDVTFLDDGTFSLLTPEQKAEQDAVLARFLEEYRARPFWQRMLIQSLVDNDEGIMYTYQFDRFNKEDFPGKDDFIEVRQMEGGAYRLTATDAIRAAFKEAPEIREDVDLEPYVDLPSPELRDEFNVEFNVSGIEWSV